MTDDQVRALLRDRIKSSGSQLAFACEHDVDRTVLSHVLVGRVKPTPQVLAALGLRKVVSYEPISADAGSR